MSSHTLTLFRRLWAAFPVRYRWCAVRHVQGDYWCPARLLVLFGQPLAYSSYFVTNGFTSEAACSIWCDRRNAAKAV